MKYKEHIINYAIDNKVSLDQARKHFIIKGKDKKEKKVKAYTDDTADYLEQETYSDPGLDEHFADENYEAADEPLYAGPEAALSPEEQQAAWEMYDSMKEDLERIYDEYIAPLTEDELLWVEYQLRKIDKIRDNDE